MGSEQDSEAPRILTSNLGRLTEQKEAPDLNNPLDKVARLTAENENLTAIIKEYKKKDEIGTSEVIQLKVNLDRLEQKHDAALAALVVAKQRQDDLEGQLRSVLQVNEGLTDQVRVLEEKKAADEGLRLQFLSKQEDFEAKFKEFVDTTKVFLDVKLANDLNVTPTTSSVAVAATLEDDQRELDDKSSTSSAVTVTATAVASDHSSILLEDRHGQGQPELVLVDDEPSTSAGAAAAQTRKRKDKGLAENSGGSKKRRETDISTNGSTEDVKADDEIVVKIEGYEVESGSEGDGLDLTAVFGNDKIMATILNYLPSKELPTLRLTCKTWDIAIIKQLKFHINNFSFTDDCVSNLFATCGKYITQLKISLVDQNVFTQNDLRNVIFNLAPALVDLTLVDDRSSSPGSQMWTHEPTWVEDNQTNPKPLALKRLTLKPALYSDSCLQGFTEFLSEVFNSATKLEHIDIAESQKCLWMNMNWEILQAVKKLPSLDNLKSLILQEISKEELDLLIRLSGRKENNLKLTSLDTSCISRTFKNFGSYDIGKMLDKFLKRQAKTLEKLTIGCDFKRKIGPGPSSLSIKLPKLDKLNQLSIYLDVSRRDREYIQFESLANNCPNLKTFEFVIQGRKCMDHSDWIKYIHQPKEPHVRVQVLRVTIDQDSSETRLSHLATLFPNVRHLTAWLDDTPQLAQMWDKWTRLESLHISFRTVQCLGAKDLDEYLTGIPTKEHEALKLTVASGLNMGDLDLTDLKTKLGLANLENLRELTLDFTSSILGGSASACIGDISVYFGFALLRKLRTLKILPARLISPVCRAALSHVLESKVHY